MRKKKIKLPPGAYIRVPDGAVMIEIEPHVYVEQHMAKYLGKLDAIIEIPADKA